MYGYVTPKKDGLDLRDFALYRAFYCGICKATGNMYGQLPRFTTNYDIVFLSVLLHDCSGQSVEFKNGGCVLNPFKKKTVVCRNGLMDMLVATNIIMSHYKVRDDVADGERLSRRLVGRFLSKAYARAVKVAPKIDAIVRENYEELSRAEREGLSGMDRMSHFFAQMLMQIAKELLSDKASDDVLKLCYNVGKFVYLIDAVDDLEEDHKKQRYNPLLVEFGGFRGRKQFISDNYDSLNFILSITVNRAIECFNNMRFYQSYDLLKNIVHIGLREKCNEVLDSAKKLPRPRI